jgi:hypothetical protein
MVEPLLTQVVQGAQNRVFAEKNVGVGEEQIWSVGLFDAFGEGMRLAQPALRQPLDMEDGQSVAGDSGGGVLVSEAVEDRAGGVGRAVIDRDDLQRNAGAAQQRADGGFDRALLIAGGDDDAEQRGVCRSRERCGLRQQGEVGYAAQKQQRLDRACYPCQGDGPCDAGEQPAGMKMVRGNGER